jgi:restriction system protein
MRLSQLQQMDPIAFERFVGQHFTKMGYKVENTRASGDEGIDLILRRGRRMAVVQCKRYGGTVGQPVVRDLYGVMVHTGADEAYLVTTGTVSRAAVDWANGKPIHLVDGHRLVEWTRTGRLTHDHKPVLSSSNRQILMLVGLTLLAVMAIYLSSPQTQAQVQQWQQTVMSWFPAPTATPTTVPAPTAAPTDEPTSSPALRPTPIPVNTVLPSGPTAPTGGIQPPGDEIGPSPTQAPTE